MARGRRKKHRNPVALYREKLLRGLRWLQSWLLKAAYFLTYLHPKTLMSLFSGNVRWRTSKTFSVDQEGTLVYSPTLWERIAKALHTDAQQRRQLVEWAQSMLPKMRVTNLNSSWADGIVLCALIDAICPGACPRYDLLKPYHRVNNCRLGLKLATKHLGIPQTIILAEEMADVNGSHDSKMKQLLSLIKWAFTLKIKSTYLPEIRRSVLPKQHSAETSIMSNTVLHCIAKGSGLMVGLVGNRSKFDILTPTNEALDLQVEISGPDVDALTEHITTIFPSRPLLSPEDSPLMQWNRLTDPQILQDLKKIPFTYTSIAEGHIQAYYTPLSEGKYTVTVQWRGYNVQGSPFSVTVADTIEKLNNLKSSNLISNKKVSFTSKQESTVSNDDLLEMKPEQTEERLVPAAMSPVTTAVLSRSSKVARSMSKAYMDEIAKQATVTRRRVLKRVMTTAGQEIVIQMAPPTPDTSRQTSVDVTEADDYSKISGHETAQVTKASPNNGESSNEGLEVIAPKHGRKIKKTKTSFDCEIIYDSDTCTPNGSRPVTPTEYEENETRRKRESKDKDFKTKYEPIRPNTLRRQSAHIIGTRTMEQPEINRSMSTPIGNSSSMLRLPDFDVKFKCSPYTEKKERVQAEEEMILAKHIGRSSALLEEPKTSTESSLTSLIETDSDSTSARTQQPFNPQLRTQQKDKSIPCEDETVSLSDATEDYKSSDDLRKNGPKANCVNNYASDNMHDSLDSMSHQREWEKDEHALHEKSSDSEISSSKGHNERFMKKNISDEQDKAHSTQTELEFSQEHSSSDVISQTGRSGSLPDKPAVRLSISLPSLSRHWTAFEFDPEEPNIVSKEDKALREGTHQASKDAKVTRENVTDPFWQLESPNQTREQGHFVMSVSDTPQDGLDCETITKANENDSMTATFASQPSSLRKDEVEKDTSTDITATKINFHERPAKKFEQSNNGIWKLGSSTQKPAPSKSSYSLTVPKVVSPTLIGDRNIRIPKAKVDKWTQGHYEEIKLETGWKRPSQYVKPRRKLIYQSLSPKQTDGQMELVENSNRVLRNLSSVSRIIQNELSPEDASHRNPNRQSTFDSGIADDQNNSFRSYSPMMPRYVHPTNDTQEESCTNNSDSRPSNDFGNRSLMTGLRAVSSPHRQRHRSPMVEKFSSKKIFSHHPLWYKKRVTFSKRILMHRRSSSRSKSGSKEEFQYSKENHQNTSAQTRNRAAKAKFKRRAYSRNVWNSQRSLCSRGTSSIDSSTPPPQVLPQSSGKGSCLFNLAPLQQDHLQLGFDFGMVNHDGHSRASSGVASDLSNANASAVNPVSMSPHSYYQNQEREIQDVGGSSCSPASCRPDSCEFSALMDTSLESVDGFGVSSVTRKQLLEEVECFRRLSDGSSSLIGLTQNSPTTDTKLDKQSEKRHIESDDDSNVCDELAEIMSLRPVADHLEKHDEISPIQTAMDQMLSMFNDMQNAEDSTEQEGTSSASGGHSRPPDPFCCKAYGSGLQCGLVKTRNNFQVVTQTVGNGCLNIAMIGPHAHSVTDLSVLYTGDDLYEVSYEVSLPGNYIITIKWSDYNIPGSPYICKVTY